MYTFVLLDVCRNNKCKNGHCVPRNGTAVCVCEMGYEGSDCGTGTKCKDLMSDTNTECLNAGGCIVEHGSAKCNCRPGFKGTQCETPGNLKKFLEVSYMNLM